MHLPSRRLAALLITGASLAAAPAAAAYDVQDATLRLDSVNAFGQGGNTWLGYLSTLAGGGAAPISPATGDTVTPASAKGAAAVYGWSFGLATAGGDYDPASGDADVELVGGIDYSGPGHGIEMTLETPRIVIDGATDTGSVFASGTKSGSMAGGGGGQYDRTKPVFDLDLSKATTTTTPEGVTTITGIAPKIHESGYAYPDSYATGAGPDRNPNTFGTFSLRVAQVPLPKVAVDRTSDLDPAATNTLTVSGTGFDAQKAIYVFYGPEGRPFGRTSPGAKRLTVGGTAGPQTDELEPDGSFTTTIDVVAKGGTGDGAYDCTQVTCAVQTATAPADATQATSTPLRFKAVAPDPGTGGGGTGTPPATGTTPPATTTPVATATATPAAATPPAAEPEAAAPRVTKARLARKRLTFRVSEPGTVTAIVQRRVGRKWKTVRRMERDVRKAGTVRLNPRLRGAGRFRVVLRTVGVTGAKGKTIVVGKRLR